MPLSDTAIRDAQPSEMTTRLYDERGLYLLVSPCGGKWWRFKYRFGGKQKTLSLGVYPGVSLEQARQRRDEYRALRSDGIDPSVRRKEEKAQEAARLHQIAETRFLLDNMGSLTLRLGKRHIVLSPEDTAELRGFLDATRALEPR